MFKDLIDRTSQVLESNEVETMTEDLMQIDKEKQQLQLEFSNDLMDLSILQSRVLEKIKKLIAEAN